MSKDFTPKQRMFIAEYLSSKNATKAAKIAGYSAKTARSAGSRLLTNVDILAAIEKSLREKLDKADISAVRIQQELKRIAFADISEGFCPGKLRALELLGKSLGLFQDKSEVKGKDSQRYEFLTVPNHSPSIVEKNEPQVTRENPTSFELCPLKMAKKEKRHK